LEGVIPLDEYGVPDPTVAVQRQVFKDVSDKRPMTDAERAEAKEIFLSAYQACGRLDLAAARAGVSVRSFYNWLNADEIFRHEWELTKPLVVNMVESRVMQLAMDPDNKAAFSACMAILNAEAPEKYRPHSTVDMNVRVMADYKGFANRNGEGN
jgi:hypothetical protein